METLSFDAGGVRLSSLPERDTDRYRGSEVLVHSGLVIFVS